MASIYPVSSFLFRHARAGGYPVELAGDLRISLDIRLCGNDGRCKSPCIGSVMTLTENGIFCRRQGLKR
jgi:hypothetical protein